MAKRRKYPATGAKTWRIWLSAIGVEHLVLVKTGTCATCGVRDHKGKKEIRNASTA